MQPGSVGSPIAGVEFQLWDVDDTEVADGEVGEIVIRGENVMKGYWHNPDATEEAMRGGVALSEETAAALRGICGAEHRMGVLVKHGA